MRLVLLFLAVFIVDSLRAQSAEELVDLGHKYYELNDFKKAIEYFDDAAQLNPDDPEIYYLMGVCKSQSGLNEEAIDDYEIALRLDPKYAEVHYEKGYSYFLLNRFPESIASFDEAIVLKPDYAEAWFNRGSVKCISGNSEGAKEDWERAKLLGAEIPDLTCD